MKKSTKEAIAAVIGGAVITAVAVQFVSTGFYTFRLAEFYGDDWSLFEHGIALNGRTGWGNKINVSDLETKRPPAGSGSVQDWCQHVEPAGSKSFVTLSVVGETSVCCWAHENQYLVPFRDDIEEGYRHYLCGEWPHLEHVRQSFETVKNDTGLHPASSGE